MGPQFKQLQGQLQGVICSASSSDFLSSASVEAIDEAESGPPGTPRLLSLARAHHLLGHVNSAVRAQSRDRKRRFDTPMPRDFDQTAYYDEDTISLHDVACTIYDNPDCSEQPPSKRARTASTVNSPQQPLRLCFGFVERCRYHYTSTKGNTDQCCP